MRAPLLTLLAIAAGGGIGALARHVAESFGEASALAGWIVILIVNVLGCIAMGFLFFWLESRLRRDGGSRLAHLHVGRHLADVQGVLHADPTVPAPELARSQHRLAIGSGFLLTGLLGGLTTFSSLGLDIVMLVKTGQFGQAILDIVLSLGLGVLGILLGLEIGRRLLTPQRT